MLAQAYMWREIAFRTPVQWEEDADTTHQAGRTMLHSPQAQTLSHLGLIATSGWLASSGFRCSLLLCSRLLVERCVHQELLHLRLDMQNALGSITHHRLRIVSVALLLRVLVSHAVK